LISFDYFAFSHGLALAKTAMKRLEPEIFGVFFVSRVANEASSLPARTQSAFRGPQPRTSVQTGAQDPGGFASLMDSRADPAPASSQKPAPKADRPAPRQDGNNQAVTPAAQSDASPAPEAIAAAESGATEGKPDQCSQPADEPVQPVEAPKAATDSKADNTDPNAAVAAVVVADPNAVAAPAVAVPAALVPADGQPPAEAAAQPIVTDGAAAPVPPAADQNAAQTKKAGGKHAAQAPASAQDADGSAEDAAANETAPADQSQAPQPPHKQAKPEAVQQQAEGVQHETTGDKPQARPASDADGVTPPAKAAGDSAPHLTTPAPAVAHQAAAPAAHSQVAPVILTQSVPVNALAVEIAGQARAGNSRFEIRLDPPELGRIDVRLDVDRDGNVTSRLVIDRADTYDLLRRDQSTLERALQQAGLKTSDNALQFSLRDQSLQDQGFTRQQRDEASARSTTLIAEADATLSEAANGYARLLRSGGGIDIRV
jgi:chemotaxis protein MotD